jgi:hypothetical protein
MKSVSKTTVSALTAITLALISSSVQLPRVQAGYRAGTYELVEHWAQLPPGTHWGVMSAVAIDSKDNIYTFQRDEPSPRSSSLTVMGRIRRRGEKTNLSTPMACDFPETVRSGPQTGKCSRRSSSMFLEDF